MHFLPLCWGATSALFLMRPGEGPCFQVVQGHQSSASATCDDPIKFSLIANDESSRVHSNGSQIEISDRTGSTVAPGWAYRGFLMIVRSGTDVLAANQR